MVDDRVSDVPVTKKPRHQLLKFKGIFSDLWVVETLPRNKSVVTMSMESRLSALEAAWLKTSQARLERLQEFLKAFVEEKIET